MYYDLFTYLQLPHLHIYSNFELSFGIFLVPQYPKFVAVDNKKSKTSIIIKFNQIKANIY